MDVGLHPHDALRDAEAEDLPKFRCGHLAVGEESRIKVPCIQLDLRARGLVVNVCVLRSFEIECIVDFLLDILDVLIPGESDQASDDGGWKRWDLEVGEVFYRDRR